MKRPRVSRVWGWVVAAVLLLIYLAWAGGRPGTWPSGLTLWTFNKSGWIVPSPGLAQLLLASTLLYAVLCGLARRTVNVRIAQGVIRWIAAALILLVSLELHVIVLQTWWPVDFGGAAARSIMPWRVAATVADLVTTGLLLLALFQRQRSPWLCALFAWHPLLLLTGPSAGTGVACLLPLLVLAALPWRWQSWMRDILIVTPGVLAVWWVAHCSLADAGPVNGLLAAALRDVGIEGRTQARYLIGAAALLELWIIVVAMRRRWEMARVWSHVLLACVLVCPRVDVFLLVPLIALSPLCLVAGAWAITGTFLGLFLLAVAGGNVEGEWVLYAVYTAPWVIEIADLALSRGSSAPDDRVAQVTA